MRGAVITPLHLTVKTQVKDITHVLDLGCSSQLHHIACFMNLFLFYFEITEASQPIIDLPFPSRRLLGIAFMQWEAIF